MNTPKAVSIAAFECTECLTSYRSEVMASCCCTCTRCQKRGYTQSRLCTMCYKQWETDEYEKQVTEAKTIEWTEYSGYLWHEHANRREHSIYFDLLEVDADLDSRPEWMWACAQEYVSLDAHDVLSQFIEDEDVRDCISLEHQNELQEFLDAWCTKTKAFKWEPNYELRVLLPKKES